MHTGLVHRDVKPANILVRAPGDDEQAFLCDFGIGKPVQASGALTVTGQVIGTVDYAAPEQISRRSLTGRADVYALGCVLYECLTSQPPFRRESLVATLFGHVNDDPPLATAANPELSRGDRRCAREGAGQVFRGYGFRAVAELASAARDAISRKEGESRG